MYMQLLKKTILFTTNSEVCLKLKEKTSIDGRSTTLIIKLSISLIEPLFFLLIELSIYRLSNQLTGENYRFIDIDP